MAHETIIPHGRVIALDPMHVTKMYHCSGCGRSWPTPSFNPVFWAVVTFPIEFYCNTCLPPFDRKRI
jgi:hypothetical protein